MLLFTQVSSVPCSYHVRTMFVQGTARINTTCYIYYIHFTKPPKMVKPVYEAGTNMVRIKYEEGNSKYPLVLYWKNFCWATLATVRNPGSVGCNAYSRKKMPLPL